MNVLYQSPAPLRGLLFFPHFQGTLTSSNRGTILEIVSTSLALGGRSMTARCEVQILLYIWRSLQLIITFSDRYSTKQMDDSWPRRLSRKCSHQNYDLSSQQKKRMLRLDSTVHTVTLLDILWLPISYNHVLTMYANIYHTLKGLFFPVNMQ